MRTPVPSVARHVLLLWGLRLQLALNQGGSGRGFAALVAFIVSAAPSVALAVSFFMLMRLPAIANGVWPDFILRLLCFVTTCVWVAWPVMSAGVDDHTEASRYAAFPISSARLMGASTAASIVEPRSLSFTAPIAGAALGYVTMRPPSQPLLALLACVVFVAFNAACARVGMHAVLTLLRQPKSGQLIGGGFVAFLLLATFIPPVDTEWIKHLNEQGVSAVPDTLIEQAAIALGRFPTGWFGRALWRSYDGHQAKAFGDVLHLAELTGVMLVVAWGLLIDFHRVTSRGSGTSSEKERQANPFSSTKTTFSSLVAREAVDLFHNPRARLLVSVPFVLSILLKLLSARSLFVYALGPSADAWVMGTLCVYGAIVMGSTFSQNTFAYDGHGFAVFLSAPMELAQVVRAKNVVHGIAGFGLAVCVAVFYVVYFRFGTGLDVLSALLSALTLVPVLLTVGNFLSVYFPVKFHVTLKRRDKVPFIASMLGLWAAGLGTAPAVWSLRLTAKNGPTWTTVAIEAAAACVTWAIYAGHFSFATRLLTQRREWVLRAVTRE